MAGWVREEERAFARRVEDWIHQVRTQHQWKRTDFLTPREQYILTSMAGQAGLEVEFYGGDVNSERQRALVMPGPWCPESKDFDIVLLSVHPIRSTSLSHGSILGSLLGTGIDRKRVGDIWVLNRDAYVAVCREVVNFLRGEWTSVGREAVSLSVEEGQLMLPTPDYRSATVFLTSRRADALVAHACQWSRSKAQEMIGAGMVQLNFVPLKQSDAVVEPGDLLSIRSFGRVRVMEVSGTSRSGRERVEIGVLKSST